MGVRGEIFSTRLILPNRTYFLNIKENRMGNLYLNIVESKNKETGGFERQSVIVFAEDLPAFLGEFDKTLKNLEKIIREQKQGGRKRSENREENPREKNRQTGKPRTGYRPESSADNRRGRGSSTPYSAESGRSRAGGKSSPTPYSSKSDHSRSGGRSSPSPYSSKSDHSRAGGRSSSPERSRDRKRVIVKKKPEK
ncbi:MAG: DUF3276 family protein [Treponema sp.]|nr:DUF3276 family protein [Treponema sp.]